MKLYQFRPALEHDGFFNCTWHIAPAPSKKILGNDKQNILALV
jgi:hypothetical protein